MQKPLSAKTAFHLVLPGSVESKKGMLKMGLTKYSKPWITSIQKKDKIWDSQKSFNNNLSLPNLNECGFK